MSEITTSHYAFPAPGQQTVHIDVDAEVLATQWFPARLRMTADARAAIRGLERECVGLGVRKSDTWWQSAAESRGSQSTVIRAPGLELTRQVASHIDRLLPADGVVTSDAGDFFLGCAPMISLHSERRYLGPTSGSMGYGVPAAVAAKLAEPQRSCVALCGDGGVMMSVQELETAVRYGLGVVVVVFNNDAYGSIVRHQNARFGGRSIGTALGNPPFDRLGDLFGARGRSVSTAEEFAGAFEEAVASDGVHVIEVRI